MIENSYSLKVEFTNTEDELPSQGPDPGRVIHTLTSKHGTTRHKFLGRSFRAVNLGCSKEATCGDYSELEG